MKARKIRKSTPKNIITNGENLYFDTETNHYIAVKKEQYAGKIRPMVAVFDKINGDIDIITVYPTETSEIAARLAKGRWIYEKANN
jgi:hypothetical protein